MSKELRKSNRFVCKECGKRNAFYFGRCVHCNGKMILQLKDK